MNTITKLPIERDGYGYWTHPKYEEFCSGRETIPSSEIDAFFRVNELEWQMTELETDPSPTAHVVAQRYFETGDANVSDWSPTPPQGEGWFIGSLHDTEDGPVCIWLRSKGEAKNGRSHNPRAILNA